MPVCALIAQRSVLIQPCNLRLITTENVDVNYLRLDFLDCEDILLCCSGGTDLVVENQVALKTSLEAA